MSHHKNETNIIFKIPACSNSFLLYWAIFQHLKYEYEATTFRFFSNRKNNPFDCNIPNSKMYVWGGHALKESIFSSFMQEGVNLV